MNVVRDRQVSIKELAIFFAMTVVLSLAYVCLSGPIVEAGAGPDKSMAWYREKGMVMLWAPMTFALLVSLFFRGKEGLRQLVKRLTIWKVGYKWWMAAILIPTVIHLTAAIIVRGGEVSAVIILSEWAKVFPAMFLFLFVIIIGEELGWRGYALPALQARMSPFSASVVLGLMWSFWHYGVWFGLALGLYGNISDALIFMLLSTINTVILSLIMTWIANGTRASIIVAMAFHAANNVGLSVASFEAGGHLTNYMVAAIVAVVIVFLYRSMFFQKANN